MNRAEVRLVYAKELRDSLRDRRTLYAMVLLPMVVYPLLIAGSGQIIKMQEKKLATAVLNVAVEGDLALIEEVAAGDTLIHWARKPSDAVARREADLWLGIPDDLGRGTDSSTVRIVYNGSDERSMAARSRVEGLLDSLRTLIAARRARDLGIDVSALVPSAVVNENVATAERMTGARLAGLVPLLLVLFLFSSGSYAAIDAFAGERERGTLEPLLATGAARESIVAGKFLSILTINLGGAFLNLTSLVLTLSTSRVADSLDVGFRPALSPWTIPLVMALAIPLAVVATSILILIAASAKTFREGQYLTFPVLMMAIVPAMAGNFPGIDDVWAAYFVPIANVAIVARQVLIGDLVPWRIITTLVVTSAFAVAGVRRASRVLATEGALAAGRVESPLAAEATSRVRAVLFFVAIDFLLFFHVGLLLQSRALYPGLVASLVGLLLIPAIIFLKIMGLPIAKTARLRRPEARFLVAPILLAPALCVAAQLVFKAVSWVLPVPEQFLQAFEDLAGVGEHGVLATYAVLALAPGVCEEFLFRGVVLGVLSRVWGGRRAAVVAAVLFAAFHLSIYRFPPVLLVGIAAGLLALRSGSLYPAVVLHVTYNALGVTLAHGRLDAVPIGVQVGAAVAFALVGLALTRGSSEPPASEGVETAETSPRTPFSP